MYIKIDFYYKEYIIIIIIIMRYNKYILFEFEKNIFIARDGDRTHAHIRELDLKSNALTTRPPGLTIYNGKCCKVKTKITNIFLVPLKFVFEINRLL
jgi:hypothetical protein